MKILNPPRPENVSSRMTPPPLWFAACAAAVALIVDSYHNTMSLNAAELPKARPRLDKRRRTSPSH